MVRKKRFPHTLSKDLLKHYREIGFINKTDFQETHERQQREGICCHYCRAIARFLNIKTASIA